MKIVGREQKQKTMEIVGREREQAIFAQLLASDKAEFLAVYGRRRVGKTFLIREYFHNRFAFYVTGMPESGRSDQLANFSDALTDYGADIETVLTNWSDAFRRLRELIENIRTSEKKVLFIDEMPWLDTPKSGFVAALEHFWNSWASGRHDILLIACGSATSWMFEKVLRNKGGLHNRVTMRMDIAPFTLKECEAYYADRGIVMSRYQMIESYMILGGVPYYLSMLDPKLGLAQNIDRLFFAPGALLKGEYQVLYSSLFLGAGAHSRIIEALARKNKGFSRKELMSATKISNGGTLTRTLDELELSGFIRRYKGFSKKERGSIYQLIDPYTLYYFNFIEVNNDEHFWQKYSISPGHSSWSGYAFETVCLLHIEQIKEAIAAGYVIANSAAWKSEHSKPGVQIDLVIDRSDNIVDLCEMKYSNTEFQIDGDYSKLLRRQRAVFLAETKTRKTIHSVLVTTYGLLPGANNSEVQTVVTMDDLFAS
jgi:AAA+ ATPase superfamily predicted ATPase